MSYPIEKLTDLIATKLAPKLYSEEQNEPCETALHKHVEALMKRELDNAASTVISVRNTKESSISKSALEQNVQKIAQKISRNNLSFQILQNAASKACTSINGVSLKMKSVDNAIPKKKNTQSFSLFDMLDQQQLLQEYVTLEGILKCYQTSSLAEVIELIEKVEAIEDIALSPQWSEVNDILFKGLTSPLSTGKDIKFRFIKFHMKMFSVCTPEYVSVRMDLFVNMIHAIMKTFENHCFVFFCNDESDSFSLSSDTNHPILSLVSHQMSCLIKMIIPMGKSISLLPEEDCNELFILVFSLLRNINPFSHPSSHPSIILKDRKEKHLAFMTPAHFAAVLDPYASWFPIWIKQISPIQLNYLIIHTGLLQDLIWRCKNPGFISYNSIVENETETMTQSYKLSIIELKYSLDSLDKTSPEQGSNVSIQDLNEYFFLQSLSMMRYIVVICRSSFPFTQVQLCKGQSKLNSPKLFQTNLPSRQLKSCTVMVDSKSLLRGRNQLCYKDPKNIVNNLDIASWKDIEFIMRPFLSILNVGISVDESIVSDSVLDLCSETLNVLANICSGDDNLSTLLYKHVSNILLPQVLAQANTSASTNCTLRPYALFLVSNIYPKIYKESKIILDTNEMPESSTIFTPSSLDSTVGMIMKIIRFIFDRIKQLMKFNQDALMNEEQILEPEQCLLYLGSAVCLLKSVQLFASSGEFENTDEIEAYIKTLKLELGISGLIFGSYDILPASPLHELHNAFAMYSI